MPIERRHEARTYHAYHILTGKVSLSLLNAQPSYNSARPYSHGMDVTGVSQPRRTPYGLYMDGNRLALQASLYSCSVYGMVWYGTVPLLPLGPQSLRLSGGSWIGRHRTNYGNMTLHQLEYPTYRAIESEYE
jgi:hypothetical protein